MGRPAVLLALVSIIGLAALAALLFLGGPIEHRSGLVGDWLVRVEVPRTGGSLCVAGEGTHCPTPLPTIDPMVAGSGTELSVPRLEVPIDHLGSYAIPVGSATLANGVLADASMTMTDGPHRGVRLRDGVARLVVLGDDGRPYQDPYADGWHEGLEPVEVSIRFTVTTLEAPTTLAFADIVVR